MQLSNYGVICALLVVVGGGVVGDAFAQQGAAAAVEVQRAIEITVRQRANPTEPVVAIAGVLTLHVRPTDGRFVGSITPGYRVPVDAPAGTVGIPLDSVLFRLQHGDWIADPSVEQLAVDGQFTGRGVNMVVHEVLGSGHDIFAQGTTEHHIGSRFARDPGRIAGPAVGPGHGDRADWSVSSETACVREIRVLPIGDDGSGGDVTVAIDCIAIRMVTFEGVDVP